jgi:lysophospholipase L1-like esterase
VKLCVRLGLRFCQKVFPTLVLFVYLVPCFGGSSATNPRRFSFRSYPPLPGFVQVVSSNLFSQSTGFGFDLGSKVTSTPGGCTSDTPFFFSVALPEGNYKITANLGSSNHATETTIKAESRRLMVENIHTLPGQFTNRSFFVNVRTAVLPNGSRVRLKPRELGPPLVLHWDEKLTLEFNGPSPSLSTLQIASVGDAVTVYLAGDSTVTDQPLEPWNSWGQMLPRFFKPGVAIANHAESGESLPSFLGERRLEKILSTIRTGDYLFVQFGHNDQKIKGAGAGAFTTYKTNLIHLITEARKHGGLPVLITPMERKAGVTSETLGDFPAAVRQTATEQNVPIIDLNAMSKVLYSALGTNLDKAFQDGTHHNNYGSYELAKCVVAGIRSNKLDLAKFLADDIPPFEPRHPDFPDTVHIPASPNTTTEKPEGK